MMRTTEWVESYDFHGAWGMVRKQRHHLFCDGRRGFNPLGQIDHAAFGRDIHGRFPSHQFVLVLNLSNLQRMKST